MNKLFKFASSGKPLLILACAIVLLAALVVSTGYRLTIVSNIFSVSLEPFQP